MTNAHQGYGFVEFRSEEDADYVSRGGGEGAKGDGSGNFQRPYPGWPPCNLQAIKIMNMIKMFGKPIRVNKSSTDKKILDVGANLFIGNLDVEVDEKVRAIGGSKDVGTCLPSSPLIYQHPSPLSDGSSPSLLPSPNFPSQLLYDTFSAFGVIVATPKLMRDPETGNSKGFGFVRWGQNSTARTHMR